MRDMVIRRAPVCAGCDHTHANGRDKPCPCGCHGFIVSNAVFLARGCENPDCEDCRDSGRRGPPNTEQGRG